MKINLTRIISASLLFLAGAVMATADGEAVLTPAKRQQALERGKALVATREITPVVADPFHPAAFAETVASMGRATGTAPRRPLRKARVAKAPRAPRPARAMTTTCCRPSRQASSPAATLSSTASRRCPSVKAG